MILACVILAIAVFLTLGMTKAQVQAHHLSLLSWKDMVEELRHVEDQGIISLALEHLEPSLNKQLRSLSDTWELIGGVDGLAKMKANALVFCAMASYIQRLKKDKGVFASDKMERDTLALRRVIISIGIKRACGGGPQREIFLLHEAACYYYLIKERLLAFYQNNSAGMDLPVLHENNSAGINFAKTTSHLDSHLKEGLFQR